MKGAVIDEYGVFVGEELAAVKTAARARPSQSTEFSLLSFSRECVAF